MKGNLTMSIHTQLRQALRTHRGRLNQLEQNIVCSENGDVVARELDKFNRQQPCWMPPTKLAKALALEVHSIVAVIMACVAMNVATPAVTACNTDDCFTDSKVFSRDGDLDNWLTASLPATEGGSSKVMKLVRDGMTSKHMAQVVTNEGSDDLGLLGKKFIEAGKTYSPKQVEQLVLKFHNGDKSIGLLDNGDANLFFIHDDKGNVFVLSVGWDDGQWFVDVNRFSVDREWSAGYQLFLRN
jgi:hypothetical protein